jgi:hypothetical protein
MYDVFHEIVNFLSIASYQNKFILRLVVNFSVLVLIVT